ncbi:cytochrome b [Dactylosporangium aurantiacum]|uniref:cytochrome bc1 complex cytochrome b subunit n=1 Tax=Dactylosporangium aurantiacum TaxID=35754 RepID=UPI0012DEC196|nr:ubiquinol-cytochrome c reductase cytochrome b subunit [Dactylosporangium aurantiacum]MDG6110195.1 ubiquinol-cytochrome c reductase cytochrome b subunit [Dactylosporangium aurantiacum]
MFPDHWSFMLGEIALYSFVTLVLTGVYLTLFYEPSTAETVYRGAYVALNGSTVSAAYASTVALSYDVRAGLLMRQAHHWSALIFVAAIVVHLCRVFFTGAFRKPRDLNWPVGVTMLALAMLNGFTGYSLPDDLLSGTGLRIIYSVVLSIPIVGSWLALLVFGGEFPAPETMPRLYISHVLLVPAVLVVLISVHLMVLVRQKHSHFPGPGHGEQNVVGSRLWPAYAVRSLSLFTGVLAVVFALGGLVQINPVWIYGPFGPAKATSPAQPDWYVAWGDGALRLFPPVNFHVFGHLVPAPFFPAVVLGGVTFLLLYAWPWLERRRTGDKAAHQVLDRPRDRPWRMAVGAWALTFFTILLLAAADDIMARLFAVPVTALLNLFRILVLTLPFVVAGATLLVARSLRAGSAPHTSELTADDVRRGLAHARQHESVDSSSDAPAVDRPRYDEMVRLWRNPDGTWRWRWQGPQGSQALLSNEVFRSRDAAIDAARVAYPDLLVHQDEPPEGIVLPEPPRPDWLSRAAAPLVWLVLAILARRRRR